MLAMSTVLYAGDIWTVNEQDKFRITAGEMKFLRKTAKHNQFWKKSTIINNDGQTHPVRRMESSGLPHAITKYPTSRKKGTQAAR
jgi:hypothetical protein